MSTVISVENLSKTYRLGQIGTGTLTNDLKVWWARKRGLPNPLLKIGQADHGNLQGETLWALKDVNFKVERGEVLGIIGRNGAGKSTLLKILSRVTAPTSGKIKVKGRVASLLEVGTGFHPDLTGRENIYLNGAILGMRKEEVRRKFDEIVAFSEVEKFIDTPVKRYSSGMYVRLAFAVAAHLDPEILLVDEVLAVGDAEFQKKCLGKMGDVAKGGRTVLFVSHNMAAVQQLCSSAALVSSGKLILLGSTQDVIEFYLSKSQKLNGEKKAGNLAENTQTGFSVKEITFENRDSQQILSLQTGSDLSIIVDFFSKELFQNLIVTMGINDNSGKRISVLHSFLSGHELSVKENNFRITCRIKKLMLLPGDYSIDIQAYHGKDVLLWEPHVISFTVEPGDVYKSGKLPPKEWGGYFAIDQEWY